jgi:hypothetical protein
MSQGLILTDALSSACWEKGEKKRKEKEREKQLGAFFPELEARHALLAVPFLTFNKLHLYPCVLRWIISKGHKEFGSFLITDHTNIVNKSISCFAIS